MSNNSFFGRLRLLCGLLVSSAFSVIAQAQPLEDVSLEYQQQGVVATIRLSGPIQYLRHFPESHGKTLEIYYNRVQDAANSEVWLDNETRKSPPSGLIPGFTVTTRDQLSAPRLLIEFSREAEYSVALGKDNRSLLITIRPDRRAAVSNEPLPFLPTIKSETTVAAPADQATAVENNKQARALMVQGRDALAAKNNEAAVDALNKLLLLPPNDYTQDGQEWVGVARERAGQIDKAKIEYDLYLRLYPEGDGTARVAQRLAGLSGKSGGQAGALGTGERKQAARWMTYGSISSRYYYGSSNIDSTYTFNNVPTTSSLSLNDQSMLITSVDLSERYVSEDYDSRVVFRDVNTKNLLANQTSLNRVSAAYGEVKNRKQDYLLRIGRQSSMGGGVLGRFDGVAGSYGDAQNLRFNGVVGTLADYSQGTKPTFFGASADKGAFSFYGINQSVGSVLDRRALGTEWRYFEDKKTAYALVDYDTYFKALNAVQLMGTAGALGGTMHFMADRRKTPSLSIRNALNGAGTSSVDALLQTMSASSLRELALARTATTSMGQVGITVPVLQKWQVGGDFRLSNTSGLPGSGQTIDPVTGLPTNQCNGTQTAQGCTNAQPGRGLEKSVTGQLIGSSLLNDNDIWSGSVTFTTSNVVNGHSYYFYNHTQFLSGWMMDTSLQLYSQKDQYGGKTTRTSPMVRGSYRFREQFTFDADCGYEKINYSGTQVVTKTGRFFYSLGLRWDF